MSDLLEIRNAKPGTIVYWVRTPGDRRVLSHRKDDDSGWWLADGSGLADHVFVANWRFSEDRRSYSPDGDVLERAEFYKDDHGLMADLIRDLAAEVHALRAVAGSATPSGDDDE
jgi:hypothetical protein